MKVRHCICRHHILENMFDLLDIFGKYFELLLILVDIDKLRLQALDSQRMG